VARQGYGNASFEVGGEEGLDIVEEFYSDQQNAAEVKTDSASVHQVMEDAAVDHKLGVITSCQLLNINIRFLISLL